MSEMYGKAWVSQISSKSPSILIEQALVFFKQNGVKVMKNIGFTGIQ